MQSRNRLYRELNLDSSALDKFVDFRLCPLNKIDYSFSKRVYKIQDDVSRLYVIFNEGPLGETEEKEIEDYILATILYEIHRRANFYEVLETGELSSGVMKKLPSFLIIQNGAYLEERELNFDQGLKWCIRTDYNIQIEVRKIGKPESLLKKFYQLNRIIDEHFNCIRIKTRHLYDLILICSKSGLFKEYFEGVPIRELGQRILWGMEFEKQDEDEDLPFLF